MKNFKLLLATATILSTTLAMGASADISETDEIEVKAEIIKTFELDVLKDINLGTIAFDTTQQSSRVSLLPNDPEGKSISGVNFHTGYEYGKICFTDLGQKASINFTQVLFKNGETNMGSFYINNFATDWTASGSSHEKKVSGETGKLCYELGGILTWGGSEAANNFVGTLSGKSTVTVVYALQ